MEENEKIEKLSDESLEEITGGYFYPGSAPTYDGYNTYYVQYGDNLQKLSWILKTPVQNLITLNNLTYPYILYVGQPILYPKYR